MKVLPIAFLLSSGSEMPFRASRNLSEASAYTKFKFIGANICSTCAPSFKRNKPLSTNTQVNCLPIALCSSNAVTDESTPPERPRRTFLSPTCSRMRATASSIIALGDHKPCRPQISITKRFSISPPCLE